MNLKSKIVKSAITSRFVEEEFLKHFSLGNLNGTVHTCIGQEMSGAAILAHTSSTDYIFSNHRCHGHYIASTGDVEGLVSEVMGKASGACRGIGGSQHLHNKGFYSNGIQGGIIPVALGLALAAKINSQGGCSIVFIGDGTLGEGVVYESLNIASLWELPLLIVLEDNGVSQSTNQTETLSGSINLRAEAFGIATTNADTWNWEALSDAAEKIINRMRTSFAPHFLIVKTFRLRAHSKGDDLRDQNEIEKYEALDPVNRLIRDLKVNDEELIADIEDRTKIAFKLAQEENSYSEKRVFGNTHLNQEIKWTKINYGNFNLRLVASINNALDKLLQNDPRVYLFGEDIKAPYGGAFKVTKDLSSKYPARIFNTPISEAAIIGIGSGMALAGFKPVIEIMFGDFLTVAYDQIVNHAAKFVSMYQLKQPFNMIIRTPMGGGRSYGPTHSQCLEKHFIGVPGLKVIAINHLMNIEEIYEKSINYQMGPILLVENKLDYGKYLGEGVPEYYDVYESSRAFPEIWIKPKSKKIDFTLLTYGGTTGLCLSALKNLFEIEDLIGQAIVLSDISEIDIQSLRAICDPTDAIIVVEEGGSYSGIGAEVISQIIESGSYENKKIARIGSKNSIIPSSKELEGDILISSVDIINKVKDLF